MFSSAVHRNIIQNNRLEIQERFIYFQDGLQGIFQTGESLANSFEAYIHAGLADSDSQTDEYLSSLIQKYDDYVQIIGMVKDTTIIYSFPHSDEEPLNVDLTEVENQREGVLTVKRKRETMFEGPLPLIIGGEGFIMRIPLLDQDGGYWGQTSIVMGRESIEERIKELARESNLEVLVYTDHEESMRLMGDEEMKRKSPYRLDDVGKIGWVVYALPVNGWYAFTNLRWIILLFGFILSVLAGISYYRHERADYLLQASFTHDVLTGLYNRRYLDMIQNTLNRDGKAAGALMYGLILIDLDRFKLINDTYGHHVGDQVLIRVGEILLGACNGEPLIFRIGGDEFLIVLPDTDSEEQLEDIHRCVDNILSEGFNGDEYLSQVGASTGSALCDSSCNSFDKVLKEADERMYKQKTEHRSRK